MSLKQLARASHYWYSIELNGEVRRAIIEAKGWNEETADRRINTYLQAIIDKTLPIMLKGDKNHA